MDRLAWSILCFLFFTNFEVSAAQNLSTLLIDPLQNPYPYSFPLQPNANTSAIFPTRKCRGVVLEEATIDRLQGYMVNGNITAVDLVNCYMRRIQQVDEYIK